MKHRTRLERAEQLGVAAIQLAQGQPPRQVATDLGVARSTFLAERAAELHWFDPWERTLEADFASGEHRWFLGGQLNVAYNCLDRHLVTGRKNKAAIIWEGEITSDPIASGRSSRNTGSTSSTPPPPPCGP